MSAYRLQYLPNLHFCSSGRVEVLSIHNGTDQPPTLIPVCLPIEIMTSFEVCVQRYVQFNAAHFVASLKAFANVYTVTITAPVSAYW
jgi:hypothetical protein